LSTAAHITMRPAAARLGAADLLRPWRFRDQTIDLIGGPGGRILLVPKLIVCGS
jgi:hypothetical protein